MRCRFVLVLFLSGVSACGGKGQRSPSTVSYSYSPAARTVDARSQGAVVSVSATGDAIVLDGASDLAKNVVVGDVLVFAASAHTPNGLLRKVVSKTQSGTQIQLATVQAKLEEAFDELHVAVHQDVEPSTMQSWSTSLQGIRINGSPRPGDRWRALEGVAKSHLPGITVKGSAGTGFEVVFDNTVLYDLDNDPATTFDQVVLGGSTSFSLSIEMEIDIGLAKMNRFQFGSKLRQEASLMVSTTLPAAKLDKRVTLATLYFPPFSVGPLLVVPQLELTAGVEGRLEAQISSQVTESVTFSGGVVYQGGQWQPYKDVSVNLDFQPPTLSASGKLKAHVGPNLNVFLYGVAGPYFRAAGYLELDADITSNPWWTLSAGVEGVAGAKGEIFGFVLLDFHTGDIIGFRRVLMTAGGPFLGGTKPDSGLLTIDGGGGTGGLGGTPGLGGSSGIPGIGGSPLTLGTGGNVGLGGSVAGTGGLFGSGGAGGATMELPGEPVPATPSNGAKDVSISAPALSWTAPTAGIPPFSYDVILASDDALTEVVAAAQNHPSTSWVVDRPLADGQRYYWRVRTRNLAGVGPWSSTFQFTCQVQPDAAADGMGDASDTSDGATDANGVSVADTSDGATDPNDVGAADISEVLADVPGTFDVDGSTDLGDDAAWVCTPNQAVSCSGGVLTACKEDGTGTTTVNCPSGMCNGATCSDVPGAPSLLWSNTTSTLTTGGFPAVDDDGFIYTRYGSGTSSSLTKIDPTTGDIAWTGRVPSGCTGFPSSDPSLTPDGRVFAVGDWNECKQGKLVAYNADGSLSFDHGDCPGGANTSPHPRHVPVVDTRNGTLYFGSSTLCAVDYTKTTLPNRWTLPGWSYIGSGGVAIDASGNVYHSTFVDTTITLSSTTPAGVARWSRSSTGRYNQLSIVSGDTLLLSAFGDTPMRAWDVDANEAWSAAEISGEILQDANGALYGIHPSINTRVVSLTMAGAPRWAVDMEVGPVNVDFVGSDGLIYVRGKTSVFALSPADGRQVWSLAAGKDICAGLVLTKHGNLFVGLCDGTRNLYNTSLDYATSAWPKVHGNRKNTCRVGDAYPIAP